jgi:hypothetical protein
MRDGALKIKFVAGEIKGVSVSPGLDSFYARMFKGAKNRVKRWPNKVENGIQVIVFGTFLLEALCNDLYRNLLFDEIPNNKLADAIWDMTKRLAIFDKLNVATAVASLTKGEIDTQKKKLKLLFDLRNRLVHYKDSDSVWETSVEFITKPENWSKAPEPELMGHLIGQKLSAYISDIDHLQAWFDKVFRIRRKTVKRKIVKSVAS